MRFLVAQSDTSLNRIIQSVLNDNGYKTDETFSLADTKYYSDIRNYVFI